MIRPVLTAFVLIAGMRRVALGAVLLFLTFAVISGAALAWPRGGGGTLVIQPTYGFLIPVGVL